MKDDKKIEDFTKNIINEVELETPSNDFVAKVMNSVKLESEISVVKKYKPLIPLKGWIFIAFVFTLLITYILTGPSMDSSILSNQDFSFFDKVPSINIVDYISSINIFDSIHLSNTFTFSFVFFSVLVVIQLFVIKNYVNKVNSTF